MSAHASGVELALRRALAFAARQRLFAPGDRVLVGMGSDPSSLGLLGFLLHARASLGVAEVAVAAIERRLDEESDDAEQVADLGRLARQLGLTFHAVRPAVRGRRVRVIDELRRLAVEQGHTRVALAPTRDDDAARVLWELLRGRGLTAIRGLAPKVTGNVVRPLLALERSEAASLASLLGVELPMPPPDGPDPSRDRLLPALEATILPRLRALTPGSTAALAGIGRESRRVQRMFAREAEALVRACGAGPDPAQLEIDGGAFAGLRGRWVARAALRSLCPTADAAHLRHDARALAHAVLHPRDLARAEALVLHGATAAMDGRSGRVTLRRRVVRGA
ncbi:MAG: ATP-binding protein [Deltaproteobacteria bacterium]|nr:ATP-binding protein [Myxococcales bacterium]MDP3216300.1 ATP-binding protein [Deltaproteobacteria bacterium]